MLTIKKHTFYSFMCFVFLISACSKDEAGQIKVKAPLRSYVVTARLDNKQMGTQSEATGILKGSYSEKSKLLTYTIDYENIKPTEISIYKGTKGAAGSLVCKLLDSESEFPVTIYGERTLSSLEERDLIKGLWFLKMGSSKYADGEIRGQVTIKQK